MNEQDYRRRPPPLSIGLGLAPPEDAFARCCFTTIRHYKIMSSITQAAFIMHNVFHVEHVHQRPL